MVMVALIAAASVVGRLRTFFDLDKPYTEASLPADAITPINTKRVTYQIFGPSDASGRISYLDVNGKTIAVCFSRNATAHAYWVAEIPEFSAKIAALETTINILEDQISELEEKLDVLENKEEDEK